LLLADSTTDPVAVAYQQPFLSASWRLSCWLRMSTPGAEFVVRSPYVESTAAQPPGL